MSKSCAKCRIDFEITDQHQAFYNKLEVPEPTFCPDCRQQRRLACRNERSLYQRNCDLCQKSMIAIFETDTEFPVYCLDCWWSDKWDPLEYGRDFDFSRPFFEQFADLMRVVPKSGLLQLQNENSDYSNLIAFCKNTYMSPGSYLMEDCYFCRKSQKCRDCIDSCFIGDCELVASSINCGNCYGCHNLINCRNCRGCIFCIDCVGCSNCFMCAGINKKEYCYKNKQYSPKEYEAIYLEESKKSKDQLIKEFKEFIATIPKKYQNQINCENSSGDYLQNCKNAQNCYDCFNVEDSHYLFECVDIKDSMDITLHDKEVQLSYEICTAGEKNVKLKFSFCGANGAGSEYLWSCFHLKDSFGCDGFHSHETNCILNKKYSPEEYQELKKRIIEHMKQNKEYGEFFPSWLSPHTYNETIANDYYPLTKEQALSKGFKWKDKNPKDYAQSDHQVPERISETPENITDLVFSCSNCSKNYKFLPQEVKIHRNLRLPLESICPDCRYLELLKFKNPRQLWPRNCHQCQKDIKTTYSPDRQEKVLCESCYLEQIHS